MGRFFLIISFFLGQLVLAQRQAPEVFAENFFQQWVMDSVPVSDFFIPEEVYAQWLRSQQPDEAIADSVVVLMRGRYPLLLETFRFEMDELRKEYQKEMAQGAVLSIQTVACDLVPGVRHKYHFIIEIAYQKKRRVTTFFWEFDAAWAQQGYHLLLPVEEKF
jgi:hypothetical protein